MKKPFFVISAIILGVLLSVPASAGGDGHLKAAQEFLNTMSMAEMFDGIVEQSTAMAIQETPQLALYEEVLRKFYKKYLSWDSIKDDLAVIYMEEFTESELKEISAFYKSPTGQKALVKSPVLFQKGAMLGQKRVQDNIQELSDMIDAETDRLLEMQKKSGEQKAE